MIELACSTSAWLRAASEIVPVTHVPTGNVKLHQVSANGSRRRLLGWAADENLLVHAYHMPFPGLGQVERYGRAFRWVPAS